MSYNTEKIRMFELKQWWLECNEGCFIAHGKVINNPRFYHECKIHTSPIKEVIIEDENNRLIFITCSKSHYIAKYNEINIDKLEGTQIFLIPSIFEKCINSLKDDKEVR